MVAEPPDKTSPTPVTARAYSINTLTKRLQEDVCIDMGRVEWDAAALRQQCDDAVIAALKKTFPLRRGRRWTILRGAESRTGCQQKSKKAVGLDEVHEDGEGDDEYRDEQRLEELR